MTVSSINNTIRTAMVAIPATALDDGSSPGKVKLYTTGEASLLVEIILNDPAFVSPPVNGVATLSTTPSPPSGTAIANGDAAVCVFTDSDDVIKFKGTVTTTGGGGEIELASTTIPLGGDVAIQSGTLTMPAG